ncbi:MAG: hypothetical protein V2A61_02195 [Calditrichota bacterium]
MTVLGTFYTTFGIIGQTLKPALQGVEGYFQVPWWGEALGMTASLTILYSPTVCKPKADIKEL